MVVPELMEVDMVVDTEVPVGLIAATPVVLEQVQTALLVELDAGEVVEEVACPMWAAARVHTFRKPHTSMWDVEVISM